MPFPAPLFQLRTNAIFRAREPRSTPPYLVGAPSQTGFTEFFCDPVNGNNMNGGSDQNSSPSYSSTNGNWNGSTGVFIPTDGSTPIDSVKPNQFAQVFNDGSTTPVFICRINSVAPGVNGAITVSIVAGEHGWAGVAPSTSATGRSIRVGGAWKGPNGATAFPTNFSIAGASQLHNFNEDWPRINFKNNSTYLMTVSLAAGGGNLVLQGFASTPGDGGRATIDWGTSLVNGFSFGGSSNGSSLVDLILTSSATSGSSVGALNAGAGIRFIRVTAKGWRAAGFSFPSGALLYECEAYNCNTGNNSQSGGFVCGNTQESVLIRCISHGNTSGTNGVGFNIGTTTITSAIHFIGCIAANNSSHGLMMLVNTNWTCHFLSCDFYNNGGHGLVLANTTTEGACLFENCNFINNGGIGLVGSFTTGKCDGYAINCGFVANKGGDIVNMPGLQVIGSNSMGIVKYGNGETPYNNPTTGDFTIVHPLAVSRGRGDFTETQGGMSGTVGYPCIGAAQARSTFIGWSIPNSTQVLSDGFVNHPYNWKWYFLEDVTATLLSGTIPPGLSLSQPAHNNIQITGTPTSVGVYTFVIRVTIDSSYADETFQLTVNDDPDEGTGGMLGG